MHMRGVVGDRKVQKQMTGLKGRSERGEMLRFSAQGVYSNQWIGQREGYSNWDFCSHMSNGTELSKRPTKPPTPEKK